MCFLNCTNGTKACAKYHICEKNVHASEFKVLKIRETSCFKFIVLVSIATCTQLLKTNSGKDKNKKIFAGSENFKKKLYVLIGQIQRGKNATAKQKINLTWPY